MLSNFIQQDKQVSRLPCWLRVLGDSESACQSRRHGLDPWSGKIPHATKAVCHSYRACGLESALRDMRGHNSEKPVHCNQRVATTHRNERKKAHVVLPRPRTAKNKKIKLHNTLLKKIAFQKVP